MVASFLGCGFSVLWWCLLSCWLLCGLVVWWLLVGCVVAVWVCVVGGVVG